MHSQFVGHRPQQSPLERRCPVLECRDALRWRYLRGQDHFVVEADSRGEEVTVCIELFAVGAVLDVVHVHSIFLFVVLRRRRRNIHFEVTHIIRARRVHVNCSGE
jgi:hypothetical protein